MTAQMARAAITRMMWAGDRGVEAGLTLVQSEAVLAELGISSTVMFGGNRRRSIVLITLAASPRW